MANITSVARLQVNDVILYNNRIAKVIRIAKAEQPRQRVITLQYSQSLELFTREEVWGLNRKLTIPAHEVCIECALPVDRLEVFPGPRCLICHDKNFQLVSADQLTAMWRGLIK